VHDLLRSTARSPAFTRSEAPYLLLDPDLVICSANAAYLRETERELGELIGRSVFEVLPSGSTGDGAGGWCSLRASLELVLPLGEEHNMATECYGVAGPGNDGRFAQKLWAPVNSPIVDDAGRVVGVLHHVEDRVHDPGPGDVARPRAPAPLELAGEQLARQVADNRRTNAELSRRNRRLRQENSALRRALGSVVSSRADGSRREMQRRRWLWDRVADRLGEPAWRSWADAVGRVALAGLPGTDGFAVVLRSEAGARQLVAASEDWSEQLEDLDCTVGEGPASTAFTAHAAVLVDDVGEEHARWPAFAPAAAASGLGGVLAFPLQGGGRTIGTMSLYRRGAGRLPPAEARDAALLAELAATVVLADLDALAEGGRSSGNDPYHEVALATGMLASQLEIDAERAFHLMRARAFASGKRLRDMARDVLARRGGLG
jgi:hypothetical protein